MAAEEEVLAEVEAVEAVYGGDCLVLNSFPPHLHISMKPRTADVSFEQFVEATIKIIASPQYPKEPPCIDLVDCKGLDEQRQKHLLSCIREKAHELSSCLMLVTLCEEAVEKLSAMNHPDGDCPLCLYPLVPEDQQNETLPFMKLMSCFHCFHSECIIRCWHWLQNTKETDSASSAGAAGRPTQNMENRKDMHGKMKEGAGNCPVCRKPFHAKDLEHVLDLVGSHSSSQSSLDSKLPTGDEKLLVSESEITRRLKFEAILKLQEENSGLIEPKRDLVVLPGMFLPQPVTTSTKESAEQQEKDPSAVASGKHASGNSNGPSSSGHRNFGARKQRVRSDHHSKGHSSRKPVQQWVRKENANGK
ncbi:hypothetical protein L6164_035519 [Bauhinia variegata]|uniref:Uncharacterized protein n=1 Tax=Bauhinia variegata TaxID=167791 RepID=A0ACB9KE85_BAUVA|nr:hypothetical protein L6164_035519 [Bauhinia variegata]